MHNFYHWSFCSTDDPSTCEADASSITTTPLAPVQKPGTNVFEPDAPGLLIEEDNNPFYKRGKKLTGAE